MENTETSSLRSHLSAGQVIPAMPLALHEDRTWSSKHQRALVRYYLEAGAGGLAVGVHSTQFEIRDPEHGLFEPVLEFCSREIDQNLESGRPFAKIAGVCGKTDQATSEAQFAQKTGYGSVLLSLSAMSKASDAELIQHCREVARLIPVIGFYLQPAIGGRSYGYSFWRKFAEIENVVAIKIAPFDRYATLEVIRAVADSGRRDIALYTGNDDNIVHDLVGTFPFGDPPLRIAGGLLGQWAIGTKKAVSLFDQIRSTSDAGTDWTRLNAALTDLNSAIFDPAHDFSGCLSGMNEMLRRDGLVPSRKCLEKSESLSPGQEEELSRVTSSYPELLDTEFIKEHLPRWLKEPSPQG